MRRFLLFFSEGFLGVVSCLVFVFNITVVFGFFQGIPSFVCKNIGGI